MIINIIDEDGEQCILIIIIMKHIKINESNANDRFD